MRVNAKDNREEARFYRVKLNGQDVTAVCFEAATNLENQGYVLLCKLNERGRKYRDPATGEAAWERFEGKVELIDTRLEHGQ